ncbi:MAG: hypothetical protein WCD79_23055 [Chthoniobacteraceae bacterium]
MSTISHPSKTGTAFHCNPLGYIQHWLVSGLSETLYDGPRAEEEVLRREGLDYNRIKAAPPSSASLNASGPFGQPWRFYYPGQNFFVEHSAFYFGLTVIDSYAFVEVESPDDSQREALLWVSGAADLWVNDAHITRFVVARYMNPDSQKVVLPLRRGINRICVQLRCFGVRDSRNLFGLQLIDPEGLSVHIPGGDSMVGAATWLDSVQTDGRERIVSSVPAPEGASITISGAAPIPWPAGSTALSLAKINPFHLTVKVEADAQTMRRLLEIPANRPVVSTEIPGDLRKARLEFIARLGTGNLTGLPLRREYLPFLARKLLGRSLETDPAKLDAILGFIDGRGDCADFALATILRLAALGLATPEESVKIRRTALSFRYWDDEPGCDAMCYWSENHSLLFHGCQLIAGRLYPGEFFSNSNRTGEAQAALGLTRCRAWFDRVEPRGLEEFNSGTYLPITIGALLNVLDFSGDATLSERAARLLDRIYEDLALHAFEGVVVSPQGRVYRNVLYPQESGTQALLSDATAKAPPDFPAFSNHVPSESWTGDWLVYTASSQNYRPPAHFEALMDEPVSRQYKRGDAEIILHKTPSYLLASLVVPSLSATVGEKHSHILPGMAGYQMLLWQATLGRECHVFVNHPGASFDESKSRPGYWYGDGVLPRLRQRGGVIQMIYNIPDGSKPPLNLAPKEWNTLSPEGDPQSFDLYPIPFTHVHWPSDAFDHQETRGHWLFGQKNNGCIAVWCSEVLIPHHDVLTGREFQARACRSAWMAICGSIQEHGGFESFINSCIARHPEFDAATLVLQTKGEDMLVWKNQ